MITVLSLLLLFACERETPLNPDLEEPEQQKTFRITALSTDPALQATLETLKADHALRTVSESNEVTPSILDSVDWETAHFASYPEEGWQVYTFPLGTAYWEDGKLIARNFLIYEYDGYTVGYIHRFEYPDQRPGLLRHHFARRLRLGTAFHLQRQFDQPDDAVISS